MIYLTLFVEFFKIGLFAVGGGYATLPFVYQFARSYPAFLDSRLIPDMLAVAQILPGAVGVNLASYVGLNVAGIVGATGAVLGLITPSIIIIVIISRLFTAYKQNKTVQAVFRALRPAALGLLVAAGFGVWRLFLFDAVSLQSASLIQAIRWKEAALFALFFAAIITLKKHPVFYIAAAAVAGVTLGL
jgi:chromate transporter